MKSALANPVRRGRSPASRPDPVRVESAREALRDAGLTVIGWAEANDEPAEIVHKVLQGRHACTTGAGHRIAVKLGIKDRERALA